LVVEDVEEVVGLPGVADQAGVVEGGQEPVGNVFKLFFVVDDSAAAKARLFLTLARTSGATIL
jgi:hypothetical protein